MTVDLDKNNYFDKKIKIAVIKHLSFVMDG